MDENVLAAVVFLVVFVIFSIGAFLEGMAESKEEREKLRLKEEEVELLRKLVENQRK